MENFRTHFRWPLSRTFSLTIDTLYTAHQQRRVQRIIDEARHELLVELGLADSYVVPKRFTRFNPVLELELLIREGVDTLMKEE